MMSRFLIVGLIGVVCFGCSSNSGSDPVAGLKAAQAAPKTAAELPKSMPPEARAAATAAMGQAKMMDQQANDPARVHAMQMMKKQNGG